MVAAAALLPTEARACGGFFCSATQQVNQAAERIVFATNGDGTVTAVIEIQYQGPAENFSWLLPISSVPQGDQIAVASNLAFQRLQLATNPQYNLVTRVEGVCDQDPAQSRSAPAAQASGSFNEEGGLNGGGVRVEASGVVGAFEYTVISLNKSLSDPADAAVEWLGKNGYDVPEGARGLLGPYLADDLFLLALRLQKGANAGSIRPIALTYDAKLPMIPIKLTAVAANENMGVLAWVLGNAQAVPMNYNALELNEARINWFNAASNYNDVVAAAADDASGQGFVTEYAQPATALQGVVWSGAEEADFNQFKSQPGATSDVVFHGASRRYAQWDGYWDVVRKYVSLPAGVTIETLQGCFDCFQGAGFQLNIKDFLAALETDVIEPARLIQDLIDSHPEVTRLYTTLSAAEMTVDPLFTFNSSLLPVSNLHTAERVIECGPGYYQSEAPWRIELPQGGVVREPAPQSTHLASG